MYRHNFHDACTCCPAGVHHDDACAAVAAVATATAAVTAATATTTATPSEAPPHPSSPSGATLSHTTLATTTGTGIVALLAQDK